MTFLFFPQYFYIFAIVLSCVLCFGHIPMLLFLGIVPQTLEEWKLLIQLSQKNCPGSSETVSPTQAPNGTNGATSTCANSSSTTNGSNTANGTINGNVNSSTYGTSCTAGTNGANGASATDPNSANRTSFASSASATCPSSANGGLANGSADWSSQITPETLTLRLAHVAGPDHALEALQECGVQLELGPQSTRVCDLLRVAEKRQR